MRGRSWLGPALALMAAASGIAGCGRGVGGVGGVKRLPGASVLLITIDTLRADALGCYGNARVKTPTLDALAGAGVRCDFAHAQAVTTLPSHTSILTGLYPFAHGVRDNAGFRLDAKVPTLATVLRGSGYATGAFVGAFPLDERFGLANGFEVYDDRVGSGGGTIEFSLPERRADAVVAAATVWLETVSGRHFLCWVHVFDPHAPYDPPAGVERPGGDAYLGEVGYVDTALAPLLARARAAAGIAGLVTIVTADHGEARGDHGELTHGLFAYEATLRVPLILHAPGALAPGRNESLSRHVDIVPTVLDLVGVAAPQGLPGRSLAGARNGEDASSVTSYFEVLGPSLHRGWAPLRGLIVGHEKLVDLPIPELYDLSRDPREIDNVAPARAARLEVLRQTLRALPGVGTAAEAGAESSEAEEKLRALGYLTAKNERSGERRFTAADDPKRLLPLDQAIQSAVDAYQRGRRGEAEATLRQVLAERPDFDLARLHLAYVLHETGRLGEAIGELQPLSAAGRADADTLSLLGLYLGEAGKNDEAIRLLAPQAARPDADLDVLNAYAVTLAGAGRRDEARAALDRILAKTPGNATALQNLGALALESGDVAGAILRFERALGVDPGLARAWNGLGVARAQAGDREAAITAWRRAVELDRGSWDTLYNLGLLLAREGRGAEARTYLERFVQGAPAAAYEKDLAQIRALLAGRRGG